MLNSKSMTLSHLSSPPMLNSAFPNTSSPPQANTFRQGSSNKLLLHALTMEKEGKQGSVIKCNNMSEEVSWFKKQTLLQVIVKIALALLISAVLFAVGIFGYEVWLSSSFASFCFVLQPSGVLASKKTKLWILFSLFLSLLVLTNHILIRTLYLLSPRTASMLYANYLTLLPSLLITITTLVLHSLSPITFPQFSLAPSLRLYMKHLSQYFHNVYKVSSYLIMVYAGLFLGFYALISLLLHERVYENQVVWLCLLHPWTFLAQGVVFFGLAFYGHFLGFWIQNAMFNTLCKHFCQGNNEYTGIPYILELLSVVSTEHIYEQLQKSGLSINFYVFSLSESRRSNGLTRTQHEQIYLHGLTWLLQYLSTRSPTLNTKINQYCTSDSTRVGSPKTSTSFWDILMQFLAEELERCVEVAYEYVKGLQEIQILVQKIEKGERIFGWVDFGLHHLDIQRKQCLLWGKAVALCRYLRILELSIEVICRNETQSIKDHSTYVKTSETGKKFEQLKSMVEKAMQNKQIHLIMLERLKKVGAKIERVLVKIPQ